MNWIDILVLVITILILVGALVWLITAKIKHKNSCSSCPAVKHMKKNLKQARKEIKNDKKNGHK